MKPIVATSTLPPLAVTPEFGRVDGDHPAEYTAAFKAARHLPAETGPVGRFAIVQVDAGEAPEKTSYALIYVPAGIQVARDTVVEIHRA